MEKLLLELGVLVSLARQGLWGGCPEVAEKVGVSEVQLEEDVGDHVFLPDHLDPEAQVVKVLARGRNVVIPRNGLGLEADGGGAKVYEAEQVNGALGVGAHEVRYCDGELHSHRRNGESK